MENGPRKADMSKPHAENGPCTFAKLVGVTYKVAMFQSVGVKASIMTLPKPEKRVTSAGSPTATMRFGRSPR